MSALIARYSCKKSAFNASFSKRYVQSRSQEKAFKFFDLTNNGKLPLADFFKAIAKCGVVVQPSDLETVFEHYAGESELVEYPRFIEEIVYREEEIDSNSSRLKIAQSQITHFLHQSNPPQEKGLANSKVFQEQISMKASKVVVAPKLRSYDELLQFIKSSIQKWGLGSLLDLAVKLKLTDKNKSHLVDRNTLSKLMPFLNKDNLNFIVDELSQNGNQVDYSILVYDLKGQIHEQTARQIDKVFELLDNRREGEFPIQYFVSRFQSKTHGEQFRRGVQLYSQFQGIDDRTFTEDDFNDFMGFLSFDYNSQADFNAAIIRPFYQEDNRSSVSQKSNRTRDFQLNKSQKGQPEGDFRKDKHLQVQQSRFQKFEQELHPQQEKKSVSRYSHFQGQEIVSSNKLKIFQSVIMRIKKRLASKGTKGFLQMQKAMKQADSNQDTLLTAQQFIQVIKSQRIDITSTQCGSIYDLFDNEGVGLISFAEFMYTLRGSIPEQRLQMAEKLWSQVRSNDNTTFFSRLRHLLNFRSHPDVQNGRRHQEEIWKQIQQTILLIQELNGVPRNDIINQAEFEEYMDNLSLSVIDDKLFESILFNFWRLDNSSSILEKYAGSRKLFDHSKNGYLLDHHRNYIKGGSVSQNAPFGTFSDPTSYTTEHRRL